jgi:transposase
MLKVQNNFGGSMAKNKAHKRIPVQMSEGDFNEFVLPYLTRGKTGPRNKVTYFRIFNYILKLIHTGCQWENLPIEKDASGKPEIHYTRVFRIFKRWMKDGCFDKIFVGSVLRLFKKKFSNCR